MEEHRHTQQLLGRPVVHRLGLCDPEAASLWTDHQLQLLTAAAITGIGGSGRSHDVAARIHVQSFPFPHCVCVSVSVCLSLTIVIEQSPEQNNSYHFYQSHCGYSEESLTVRLVDTVRWLCGQSVCPQA